MRKIMLTGRTGCGKTTLTQALRGQQIEYHKTHYINHFDVVIDTPGEYAESKNLAGALAIYGYEADVIGILISAADVYSLYPPNLVSCINRDVIGIITQIDLPDADVSQASEWLKLAGCEKIFAVSAYRGQGIQEILDYLNAL